MLKLVTTTLTALILGGPIAQSQVAVHDGYVLQCTRDGWWDARRIQKDPLLKLHCDGRGPKRGWYGATATIHARLEATGSVNGKTYLMALVPPRENGANKFISQKVALGPKDAFTGIPSILWLDPEADPVTLVNPSITATIHLRYGQAFAAVTLKRRAGSTRDLADPRLYSAAARWEFRVVLESTAKEYKERVEAKQLDSKLSPSFPDLRAPRKLTHRRRSPRSWRYYRRRAFWWFSDEK